MAGFRGGCDDEGVEDPAAGDAVKQAAGFQVRVAVDFKAEGVGGEAVRVQRVDFEGVRASGGKRALGDRHGRGVLSTAGRWRRIQARGKMMSEAGPRR